MSTVSVHLDYQQFHQRPTDNDLTIITLRMEEPIEISIEKLSEELTFPNGKTFYPACYDGIRSIVN